MGFLRVAEAGRTQGQRATTISAIAAILMPSFRLLLLQESRLRGTQRATRSNYDIGRIGRRKRRCRRLIPCTTHAAVVRRVDPG